MPDILAAAIEEAGIAEPDPTPTQGVAQMMPALAMPDEPPPAKRRRIDAAHALHDDLSRALKPEATLDTLSLPALTSACNPPSTTAFHHQLGSLNQHVLVEESDHLQLPPTPPEEEAPESLVTPAIPSPSQFLTYKKRSAIQPYDDAVTRVLLDWYNRHRHLPYPTKEEVQEIAREAGIRVVQVRKWFANKRLRDGTVLPLDEVSRRHKQQLHHAKHLMQQQQHTYQ